jgi:Ca2+-binding RTX toxin-like protein
LGDAGDDSAVGGDGDDTLAAGLGQDRLFGGTGNDSLSGNDGNDTLTGGFGNDSLVGGTGNDTLIGVEPTVAGSGVGFGAGEVDRLRGDSGRDTFVLGDANRVYYSDGNPLTTGESDYALITDFNSSQDVIQLKGSAGLYLLDFYTSNTRIDAALIYDPGVSARGEVIGILQNVSSSLSLTSSAFSYV